MNDIHQILKYDFAPIDIVNFLNDFKKTRQKLCLSKLNIDLIGDHRIDLKNKISLLIKEICENETIERIDIKKGFEVVSFLKHCLLVQTQKKMLGDEQEKIVNRLQKKFEVFHRLYNFYDHDLRKTSDHYQDIEVYALMSVVLNFRYIYYGNYNDINTALKINDLILFSDWKINDRTKSVVALSLLLEQKSLFH